MSIQKEEFGRTKDGAVITKYTLENKNGMRASVINYGAILTNLYVKDDKGVAEDIVLGYDTLKDYEENGSFFGATVGPYANRICKARFTVDGKEYQVDVNDGPNNLHSHYEKGYHKRVYDVKEGENSVTFSLKDEDGNMGFPANKEVAVTYTLTDANEIQIHYEVSADKDTVINMTNHSYFNLNGHASGKILDHELQIAASHYTPVLQGAIPTGEIADVTGTVFDFRTSQRVGDHIEDNEEQLKLVQGYDHNWVVDTPAGKVRHIATVNAPGTSRVMEVYSDQPSVQFYAGNCIAPTVGKGGVKYGPRCGLCLETQVNPDSANHPEWPSCIYGPNRKFISTTVYKFN